ncbi:hypothetical protein SANTM175S_02040 [Streptomyces antimycoticus]
MRTAEVCRISQPGSERSSRRASRKARSPYAVWRTSRKPSRGPRGAACAGAAAFASAVSWRGVIDQATGWKAAVPRRTGSAVSVTSRLTECRAGSGASRAQVTDRCTR